MTEPTQISLFGGGSRSAAETADDPPALPGLLPDTAIPVSELNAAAREVLEGSFRRLWVVGEVANWRRMDSGQCYFSLRDESSQISCVMWRTDARRLPAYPEEGMEICAFGRVSLYEARGVYQLIVQRLEARGEGLWKLAFEKVRRRLAAEGLLDPERRRPLPRLPARVGVVTSRGGAALRDVIAVIRRRAPATSILVSHCRVQGEGAPGQVVAAIRRAVEAGRVDVLVVTRGGGSAEDLWCFNEERVARAVAACPVPVVSAVGHEVDLTIVDLVADVRAATPSAAAELVVPDIRALRGHVSRSADRLLAGLRGRALRAEARRDGAAKRLDLAIHRIIERGEDRLRRGGARLEALSPLGVLARGYSVATDPGGRVLRRAGMFEDDAPFRLRVVDGEVAARVEGVTEGAAHEVRRN